MSAPTARRPLPVDPGLPSLQLLHPRALADTLAADLGGPSPGVTGGQAAQAAEVTDARVRYLEWSPGTRLVAHVDALVRTAGQSEGGRREAVLRSGGSPEVVDQVRWLPDDPDLPLLSVGWARAARRLAYVPGRRVALRVADSVLKGYASHETYARAQAGLEVLHAALGEATPRPERPMHHLLTTVQRAHDGEHPGLADAVGAGPAAGGVLARLHASRVTAPRSVSSIELLSAAGGPVRLLEAALPAQGRRARLLLDVLGRHAPADDDLVLSHGDFTREQLLTGPAGIVVLDADTVALAPRALDLASYPANLVSGRNGDLERAQEALDALLDGYGTAPRSLDWHLAAALLRRCDRPFRRLKSRWDDRTGLLLDITEEVTRRCAAVRI